MYYPNIAFVLEIQFYFNFFDVVYAVFGGFGINIHIEKTNSIKSRTNIYFDHEFGYLSYSIGTP